MKKLLIILIIILLITGGVFFFYPKTQTIGFGNPIAQAYVEQTQPQCLGFSRVSMMAGATTYTCYGIFH